MSQDILNGVMGCLRTALSIHETGARNTGRTERLLAQVRERDVIICGSVREADRLRRLLRERGVTGIQVSYSDPSGQGVMQTIQNYRRMKRFLFDHSFIHAFMLKAVEGLPEVFTDIEKLNERLSQQDETQYQEGKKPHGWITQ